MSVSDSVSSSLHTLKEAYVRTDPSYNPSLCRSFEYMIYFVFSCFWQSFCRTGALAGNLAILVSIPERTSCMAVRKQNQTNA